MYPLAPNPIYRSFQGEGHMIGVPMVFVRLAGCSVGCPLCDTDYKKQVTMSADEIARYVRAIGPEIGWVWITGGEPTDHDLTPLVAAIRRSGYRLALATSGVRAVKLGGVYGGFDFLSVSPHDPNRWVHRSGDQLNIVPGLNGFGLADFVAVEGTRFSYRYATPCQGKPETLAECVAWVEANPGWRLGIQAHKHWELP